MRLQGLSPNTIAQALEVDLVTVYTCFKLQDALVKAFDRVGRPSLISKEAKEWICQRSG
jgi:hypothetical protein